MAPSFGRSISFPLSPARSSSKLKGKHVRSTSLPCRSHPLLAHLQTHIAAVRAWDPSTTSPSAGLAHVAALHSALADLIINGDAALSDRLLDAFLLLADAHRGFQETLLALKADVADLQAAIRRSDATRLASAARSQRRNNKDLARLAASIAAVPKTNKYCSTEMAVAIMDAAAASAAASAAVFSAVASMSKTFAAAFTKKKETPPIVEDKLEELAQCIHDCETGSETVFRTIVRTRVSLLNIRTPAI